MTNPNATTETALERDDVLGVRLRVHTLVDVKARALEKTLDTEIVDISRVLFDTPVDQAPEVRTKGNVLIVPMTEAVMVFEKRLVLKEKLHIKRRVVVDRETVAGEQNREEE